MCLHQKKIVATLQHNHRDNCGDSTVDEIVDEIVLEQQNQHRSSHAKRSWVDRGACRFRVVAHVITGGLGRRRVIGPTAFLHARRRSWRRPETCSRKLLPLPREMA